MPHLVEVSSGLHRAPLQALLEEVAGLKDLGVFEKERSLVVGAFGIAHASHEVPHLVEVFSGLHRAPLQALLEEVAGLKDLGVCEKQQGGEKSCCRCLWHMLHTRRLIWWRSLRGFIELHCKPFWRKWLA